MERSYDGVYLYLFLKATCCGNTEIGSLTYIYPEMPFLTFHQKIKKIVWKANLEVSLIVCYCCHCC